jgi:Zn-dependent protease with chaperone function
MEAGAAGKAEAAALSVARAMRLPPPDLLLLDDAEPQILCRGMRRPRLVVSRGAVERLSPEELRAALAHELAHQEQGDLKAGWLLLALRAALFFNPVAQGIGRQALVDFERRADDRAAEVIGDPLVVASALVRLARTEAGAFPGSASGPEDLVHIEARGRRLLEHGADFRVSLPGPRLVVTAASVALLAFFVV